MGDLIAFTGFENASTPFDPKEHTALWKTDRRYPDFTFDNTYNPTCQYPRFWNESGGLVLPQLNSNFSELVGCYESEFDQVRNSQVETARIDDNVLTRFTKYGDTEAFGVFPDWQRQLSKFASVQDRLREWNPSVLAKLQQMSCVTIGMLDIDGFRFDKATQVTVDAQANFTQFLRQCAKKYGKDNFFLPGEVTGGNTFGSIYFGRGREPQMVPENNTVAVTLTSDSNSSLFLREPGKNALDAAAFHYSIYRSLTRFLGMDGNLTAGYDVPVNFVDTWNTILSTNDLVNANTGEFDPRHMYGTSNQDVFRWPGIENGVDKMLMALYVTTLYMPGIPLLLWGEEQAFYVLDSTADNYLFGRQAMSAAHAWQDHGCYKLGSSQYYDFPVDALNTGCLDDSVSLDHRDPTHPVRNIIKSMYYLREQYPVLNDGYLLDSLSNQTHYIYLPGSNGTPTETGMWSVLRDQWFAKVQDLGGEAKGGNQSVWLVYSNDNRTVNYAFDCHDDDGGALIAPFAAGTTVKNLLSPYDTLKLVNSTKKLGIDNSRDFNGCLEQLQMGPWDYRAYVPEGQWIAPPPMMTKFVPGHDARILSTVQPGQQEKVDIEFQFSQEMDCDSISQNLVVNSSTSDAITAQLDNSTVTCGPIPAGSPTYIGQVMSTWSWKGTLIDVSNGVHTVTVSNATTPNDTSTGSVDRVMFRIGQADNVMVFPRTANYSAEVLLKDPSTGDLSVNQKAAGADMWRYSLTWGSLWSNWTAYDGTNSTLAAQPWSGTNQQKWKGDHVMLQYWSRMTGSSDYVQHGDVASQKTPPRRFPHLFAEGPFNQFGFDGGLHNSFDQDSDGTWKFHLMTEWPSHFQVNVWGMNPDGQPDQTFIYGDVDNDTVLDRLPPDALAPPVVNMSQLPPSPYLAYEMRLTDGVNKFQRVPVGSRLIQILVFSLLWALPVLTGAVSIWAYMGAFYGVKFNKIGLGKAKIPTFGLFRRKARFQKLAGDDYAEDHKLRPLFLNKSRNTSAVSLAPPTSVTSTKRRKVIIATMEYDIEDWSIKIKIGGLGVMAQLMGKSLEHQDLIWVVPCVGGVDYPVDQPAEPMTVTILGSPYEILVQYHQLKNITYVLLDAPVFRQQTKNEPYPPRMDDLDSAIYYSAWNACIAETVRRFQPDIYHINDYHGAAAPLYLLPETIPACLSLHNAEFQGLWPMRNLQESSEVCRVYNLDPDIVQKYVQFGEVFNLLHAGASYLRVHQKGFGAVGVSNKYGARSFARYPIFWGLKEIGKLPNPDPSDTAPWSREEEENQVITVDPKYEASRADLRKQAQEWAGLNVDPKAELFTFVGRWSNQKGVDLIADVFPSILEKHPKVQLICVGPVIDLYGKFAALKLGEMMKKYPKRVFSKPEFTALPPYIFSGSEFALIPSRDEPFGLVAVEFGRKGALGVGARVGGLGQMPGWWFTVESTTTSHMIHQFKSAIEDALNSKTEVRAMMRARSAKQRFPVAKWVEDLDILQSTAIKIHHEQNSGNRRSSKAMSLMPTRESEMVGARSRNNSPDRHSIYESAPEQTLQPQQATGLSRNLSLGSRRGPGHRPSRFTINIEPSTPIGPRIEEEDEDDASLYSNHDEYTISREEADAATMAERERSLQALEGGRGDSLPAHPLPTAERGRGASRRGGNDSGPSRSPSPAAGERLLAADEERGRSRSPARQSLFVDTGDDRGRSRSPVARDSLLVVDDPRRRSTSQFSVASRASMSSMLDLSEVKGDKTDFNLQKVELSFNDTTGEYYNKFEQMLQNLNGKTSEKDLCIEEYLVESEKAWFKKYRDAKLGRSRDPSPAAGAHVTKRQSRASVYSNPEENDSEDAVSVGEGDRMEDFLLGENYHRPSIIKRWMQTRIGDWPIYSLFLALGQIIAANSYQITLLTGGEEAGPELLYIIGGIYIVTSGVWWVMFRTLKARWVLSVPFIFYGLAFAFVGFAPFLPKGAGRSWMRNVADGMYTAASSSGSLFFTLNFGDEGMSFASDPNFLHPVPPADQSHRRLAHQNLGLPRLHNPRNPEHLHDRALLLGPHHNPSNGDLEGRSRHPFLI